MSRIVASDRDMSRLAENVVQTSCMQCNTGSEIKSVPLGGVRVFTIRMCALSR
jgi:hypothetical protein